MGAPSREPLTSADTSADRLDPDVIESEWGIASDAQHSEGVRVRAILWSLAMLATLSLTGCAPAISPEPASPEGDFDSSKPTPTTLESSPGTPLEVTIVPTLTAVGTAGLLVVATSNLPDGAELLVGLFSDGYHGQDQAVIGDGTASFGPFSDDGAALPAGKYELSVSMSIARLQPEAVQAVIGRAGELMTGPLVSRDDITGDNSIDYTSDVTIH